REPISQCDCSLILEASQGYRGGLGLVLRHQNGTSDEEQGYECEETVYGSHDASLNVKSSRPSSSRGRPRGNARTPRRAQSPNVRAARQAARGTRCDTAGKAAALR